MAEGEQVPSGEVPVSEPPKETTVEAVPEAVPVVNATKDDLQAVESVMLQHMAELHRTIAEIRKDSSAVDAETMKRHMETAEKLDQLTDMFKKHREWSMDKNGARIKDIEELRRMHSETKREIGQLRDQLSIVRVRVNGLESLAESDRGKSTATKQETAPKGGKKQ